MEKTKISRNQIREKLFDWEKGIISTVEIHQWAGNLYPAEHNDWEINDGEEYSVANETLAQLDMLDMNLITRADIPAIISFLNTPFSDFSSGYKNLDEYLKSRDISLLTQTLKNKPPYSPFL